MALEQPRGVRVVGNIRTLACMKDRSGREAITLAASALRCSSFLGFLLNRRKKYKKIQIRTNKHLKSR